jgi:hypothetical protein
MFPDIRPLLYKIAVDLGAYPFPTGDGTRFTRNRFLIFVGLCTNSTEIQDSRLIKITWPSQHTRHVRNKPWHFQRLLFQSMSNSKVLRNVEARSAEDDEDLIDVLQSCRPDKEKGWEEEELIPTIAALPSSRSRSLRGIIKENDLRSFLHLLVCVALRRNDVEYAISDLAQNIVRSLLGLFEGTDKLPSDVDWESFSSVISKQLVGLETSLNYPSTNPDSPIY